MHLYSVNEWGCSDTLPEEKIVCSTHKKCTTHKIAINALTPDVFCGFARPGFSLCVVSSRHCCVLSPCFLGRLTELRWQRTAVCAACAGLVCRKQRRKIARNKRQPLNILQRSKYGLKNCEIPDTSTICEKIIQNKVQ